MKSRVLTDTPPVGNRTPSARPYRPLFSDSLGRRSVGLVGGDGCGRRGGLRIGDGHHRRPQDAVAAAETLPQHGCRGRDAHLRRRVVDDGLVQRRVERVPRHSEGLHAQAVEQAENPLGDDLERAGEVAVVAGPLDVVDDREQLQGEPLRGLVDDQRAVAVDPPPVVGVLGGDPLQVVGPLGQLLREVFPARGRRRGRRFDDRRLVLAHLLPWGCIGGGAGRGAGRLCAGRHPHLTGDRVDAPLVADDNPRLLFPVTHRRSVPSSSTISASTTSSSLLADGPACPSPGASPAPAAAAPSACCAYSAPPTSWDTRATFSCAALIAAMSDPPRALRSSVSASPSSSFLSAGIFSPFSARNFSVWYCSDSARLRVSASSRRFLSSSACASASFIIRSMSSLGRAEPPVMVIDCSLPVPRSLAVTWTMPLASMSNATSICGTPRGAGGRPVSSNMPSFLL